MGYNILCIHPKQLSINSHEDPWAGMVSKIEPIYGKGNIQAIKLVGCKNW